jgi:putative membrane protein
MLIDQRNWFKVAFQIKGSAIPAIFPRILLSAGLGLIITLIHDYGISLPEDIFGNFTSNVAYNLVLGLLLVFRTNTAYDRYWEGRKTWGGIMINTLNLGRKIQLSVVEKVSIDKDNKKAALNLLGAFAIATKLHLRKLPVNGEIEPLLTQFQYKQLQEVKNPPQSILLWISEYIKEQQLKGCLSIDEMLIMNHHVDNMVEAVVGCERILKTPMPLAYSIYLKRLLLLYCFTLPLQLVHDLMWWTPLIVALMSFILFGIEEIGNQIENPFGNDANDLPLDEISHAAVKNLEDLTVQTE